MFHSADELVERLASIPERLSEGDTRPITFVIGSGAVLPRPPSRGVPGVKGIVDLIRQRLAAVRCQHGNEGHCATCSKCLHCELSDASYQRAFEILIARRGQDTANRVIRDAVLQARRSHLADDPRSPEEVESDVDGWFIPSGICALCHLIAHHPQSFGAHVLTTNFDPLIEVGLSAAKAPWYSTSLHTDGSLLSLRGTGTCVVHLHGHWWGSDTLHSPSQLGHERPQLAASLQSLLAKTTLVIMGYGGWDDAFMRALQVAINANGTPPDIIWTFYSESESQIEQSSEHVLRMLSPLSQRGRCTFYKGIDFSRTLEHLLSQTLGRSPAESLPLFLDRVAMIRRRQVVFPSIAAAPTWTTTNTPSETTKALASFNGQLPAWAALSAARYLLHRIERQPIHRAPNPQQFDWVRPLLKNAHDALREEQASHDLDVVEQGLDRVEQEQCAVDDQDSFDAWALKCLGDALCSVLAYRRGEYARPTRVEWARTSSHWAAAAVHLAARCLDDDEHALLLRIARELPR